MKTKLTLREQLRKDLLNQIILYIAYSVGQG